MTQEEKQILLKDLCSRLFYGVRARFCDGVKEEIDDVWDIDMFSGAINADYIIDDVKPYLRPMSSMTEEEKDELLNLRKEMNMHMHPWIDRILDFYLSHHLDWRGLILLGLALEAPEGMYKTE